MTRSSKIKPSRPSIDDADILQSLQNIPSNFDLALNGGARRYQSPNPPLNDRNARYVSPRPFKEPDGSLLNPEGLRRLSIDSISSNGREPVENLTSPVEPKTWKTALKGFWHRNQGLFLVSFSQLFGALMNVATRLLELEGEGMHPFQVLFARMTLTSFFCCIWMWRKKTPDFPIGPKGIRLLLTARGFSGFFGIFGMYYSLQYLPVADAIVITFLAPSVASYACYLFLKEPFPRSAQYASLVSLLGVVLIARPVGYFLSPSPEFAGNATASAANGTNIDSGFPVPTSQQRLSAVAIALLGVLGSAGAYTSIRWIGNRAHPLILVNYFAVLCTIVSTSALLFSKPLGLSETLTFSLPAGLRQWSLLLFLGVCGFITQFLLTTGLAAGGKGNGARATNMIYTNMLFALALDKLVFGQSPGWWSLAGSGLILGSAVFIAVQQQAQPVGRPVDEEMELRNREEGVVLLGGEVAMEEADEAEAEVEVERGRSSEGLPRPEFGIGAS
jgi:drug/metabolite transporter (DMT)-like permease